MPLRKRDTENTLFYSSRVKLSNLHSLPTLLFLPFLIRNTSGGNATACFNSSSAKLSLFSSGILAAPPSAFSPCTPPSSALGCYIYESVCKRKRTSICFYHSRIERCRATESTPWFCFSGVCLGPRKRKTLLGEHF